MTLTRREGLKLDLHVDFGLTLEPRAARLIVETAMMLAAARALRDLSKPPRNRLEALKDDRKGQYSIRINDQFRVCFVWIGSDAKDVEIVDYN